MNVFSQRSRPQRPWESSFSLIAGHNKIFYISDKAFLPGRHRILFVGNEWIASLFWAVRREILDIAALPPYAYIKNLDIDLKINLLIPREPLLMYGRTKWLYRGPHRILRVLRAPGGSKRLIDSIIYRAFYSPILFGHPDSFALVNEERSLVMLPTNFTPKEFYETS
jgi:hypothetical protein